MAKYFLIADSTGRFIGNGSCPDELLKYQPVMSENHISCLVEEETWNLVGDNMDRYRLLNGAPVEKDENPAVISCDEMNADGEHECHITGIPIPSFIEVTGAVSIPKTVVDDGEVIFTTSKPGRICVTLESGIAFKAWRKLVDAT